MKFGRQARERPELSGLYCALITPRREGEVEVDLGGMLEEIDFVTSRGVQGVVLFGSTGEFLHFTPEERSRFAGLATKRSRVPVLANVSHSTLDGAIAMAEEAAGAGVAGVLAMPPYFFRYDADAVCSFFRALAEQVAKWTPVYLYNIPMFTNPLTIEAAESLLRSGMFAGIKDSSGDWSYLERLLKLEAELGIKVLCGDDALFARARRAGATAGVSGVAAAVPELMAALHCALGTDGDRAARVESRLAEFILWSERFPAPVAIREAAVLRGIKAGKPAAPLGEQGNALLAEFRAWFSDWIKVIERECRA